MFLGAAALVIFSSFLSGCSHDLVSANTRHRDPVGEASTLAGDGLPGPANDGPAATAHFTAPVGVAVARDRTVYVADAGNHTIRQISSKGKVTLLAGADGKPGTVDGPDSVARFNAPAGLALDALGTLYVVEGTATIRKITPGGVVSTFATLAPEPAAPAVAHQLLGVAVGADGIVYTTDAALHVVYRIGPDGTPGLVAGKPGKAGFADDLRSNEALFDSPRGIALSRDGRLIVADVNNFTLRTIDPDGRVASLAGLGGRPGLGSGRGDKAGFGAPTGVAVDAGGALYVTDAVSHIVRRVTYDPLTLWVGTRRDSWVSTWVGMAYEAGHAEGQGSNARFRTPSGVAVGRDGTVYVAEQDGRVIRAVKPTRPMADRAQERLSWLRQGRHTTQG